MAKKVEKLSEDERKRIFEEYSFDYCDESDIDKRQAGVDRQRYVYEQLHKKGLEETAVEKLLDLTLEDIECQHSIKSGIENKAGFILALWGILVATMIDGSNYLLGNIKYNLITNPQNVLETIFVLIIIAVPCAKSLYYIYQSIRPHEYKKFAFDEKEYNFKSAVEDKYIAYTTLLDNVTNSWISNRKYINEISENYHKAIKWVIIFAAMVIVAFALLG